MLFDDLLSSVTRGRYLANKAFGCICLWPCDACAHFQSLKKSFEIHKIVSPSFCSIPSFVAWVFFFLTFVYLFIYSLSITVFAMSLCGVYFVVVILLFASVCFLFVFCLHYLNAFSMYLLVSRTCRLCSFFSFDETIRFAWFVRIMINETHDEECLKYNTFLSQKIGCSFYLKRQLGAQSVKWFIMNFYWLKKWRQQNQKYENIPNISQRDIIKICDL